MRRGRRSRLTRVHPRGRSGRSQLQKNGLDAGQMFSTGQRMVHTWACDVPERVAQKRTYLVQLGSQLVNLDRY